MVHLLYLLSQLQDHSSPACLQGLAAVVMVIRRCATNSQLGTVSGSLSAGGEEEYPKSSGFDSLEKESVACLGACRPT